MSSKLLNHRAALSNIVRRIAVEAGEVILRYYDGLEDLETEHKDDGSPVTLADRDAERLIEQKLHEILPDVPMIGEEGVAEGRIFDLAAHPYFWLVDPLDGTKDFLAGGQDFTVNIALIHKGDPVLGVIYAPEKGELYMGFTNEDGSSRAFRHFEDSNTEKDLRVRKPPAEGLTIISSHSPSVGGKMDKFLQDYKVAKIVKRASSLKICAIAAGKADMYPRLGPTGEWDTAAGDAVLRAAGGVIKDFEGRLPLRYGCGVDGRFLNPSFVAASGDLF
jgi:3'(2'), 5'-bisphosphate nucleotidase